MRRQPTWMRVLIYVALVAGSAVMLVPLAWMMLTSVKSFDDVLHEPPVWWPSAWHWENYWIAFTEFRFSGYLVNSTIVTGLTILGTLVSSSLVAYAFACLNTRGKGLWFGLLLATLMLPGQVTIIPLFMMFVAMGWINTFYPLIVPAWMGLNVFAIFLLRQFFLTIPRDYVEAARLDGASELHILWSIYLPLSRPALLTITVFTFLGSWNDLWGPLIYLHDDSKYTMPLGLLNFITTAGEAAGTPWHLVMAVTAVMILPTIVIFFIAQKHFIQGMVTTGLKG